MSILKLPAYHLYLSKEMRYTPVPVADNTMKDNPGNKGNKLYKVAPVIDHVKQNCNEMKQYSISPQMNK